MADTTNATPGANNPLIATPNPLTGFGGQGGQGGQGSQSSAPAFALTFKWLGALFALWVILVALAQLAPTRDLSVALAWLVAVAALIYVLDPNGVNAAAKLGLG